MKHGRSSILLGASGFLGRNIYEFWMRQNLADQVSLIRVAQNPLTSDWIHFEKWTQYALQLKAEGQSVQVINCIAIAELRLCDKNPSEALRINKTIAVEIAQFCKKHQFPLVQISSDGLYSHTDSSPSPHYWKVEDNSNPVTVYGQTKLAAENALATLNWGHCIRLSFIGPGLGTSRGLITFLARGILSHETQITAFSDVWFSPIHVGDFTFHLLTDPNLWKNGYSLLQWGCYPAITKFEFLVQVSRAAGYNPNFHSALRSQLSGAIEVPLDQSLKSDREFSLQTLIEKSAISLKEEIEAIKDK